MNNNNMIKKNKYTLFIYNLILCAFLFFFITSCGLYKKSDARKVSPNPAERVKVNMEKGEGFRIKNLGKGGKGNFQFASSNEIRADGLEVSLHKKTCNQNLECSIKKYLSKTSNEIKLAILKRATIISKMDQDKYLEENGEVKIYDN